ncbi:MAG: MotA/TolQ/ExbB proton channel family protein [Halobacteriovoraceae bacterium]|nr:MotA/TolQ/ExbB proton channel family protein [Halobacteriovoraceae bacterium]
MRLIDYISEGGFIMYILVLLNIIGMTIILWKIISIYSYKNQIESWSEKILASFKGKISNSGMSETLKHELLKDEIGNHITALEFGLNTVKIIASIAPLLGLLGTVIGILSAFEVISERGLNDPSLFAGGISMALVTTVGGLIVAIPHFIGYNYLIKILDSIETKLENKIIPKAF